MPASSPSSGANRRSTVLTQTLHATMVAKVSRPTSKLAPEAGVPSVPWPKISRKPRCPNPRPMSITATPDTSTVNSIAQPHDQKAERHLRQANHPDHAKHRGQRGPGQAADQVHGRQHRARGLQRVVVARAQVAHAPHLQQDHERRHQQRGRDDVQIVVAPAPGRAHKFPASPAMRPKRPVAVKPARRPGARAAGRQRRKAMLSGAAHGQAQSTGISCMPPGSVAQRSPVSRSKPPAVQHQRARLDALTHPRVREQVLQRPGQWRRARPGGVSRRRCNDACSGWPCSSFSERYRRLASSADQTPSRR